MIRPGALLLVGVGCGLASVAVAGCAHGEMRQVLRAQVASELDCPEVRVQYKDMRYHDEDPTKERYKITGCGVERTYTCPQDAGLVSYDDNVCTFVEGDPDRPQLATVEADEAADEPMDEPVDEPAPVAKPKPKAKKPKPTGLPRAVEPTADEPEDAKSDEGDEDGQDGESTGGDDLGSDEPPDPSE